MSFQNQRIDSKEVQSNHLWSVSALFTTTLTCPSQISSIQLELSIAEIIGGWGLEGFEIERASPLPGTKTKRPRVSRWSWASSTCDPWKVPLLRVTKVFRGSVDAMVPSSATIRRERSSRFTWWRMHSRHYVIREGKRCAHLVGFLDCVKRSRVDRSGLWGRIWYESGYTAGNEAVKYLHVGVRGLPPFCSRLARSRSKCTRSRGWLRRGVCHRHRTRRRGSGWPDKCIVNDVYSFRSMNGETWRLSLWWASRNLNSWGS